ncbi:MAG: hypothetical protein CEO22_301 [Candidatus Berkelbacteria bacterium Gr01-1014_85]|uniref:Uncharacterized protein n=1 Tax=Candidatus Berkelbacteria bacterium Gr01-1014_85 TaxID=2017150 RepID=A0A554JC97_9BACT|nr:MAG: hypothetical protein CEO22_301 [Candidatus Berkelbacteria bacterium Gr01-1014_85]
MNLAFLAPGLDKLQLICYIVEYQGNRWSFHQQ